MFVQKGVDNVFLLSGGTYTCIYMFGFVTFVFFESIIHVEIQC